MKCLSVLNMPKSILHLLLVPILDVHSSLYQKRNICTCTFGYPAQGTQCDSNGENCASCWSEYELVGQSCQPAQNQCVCVTDGLIAGTPVGPEDCAADGDSAARRRSLGEAEEIERERVRASVTRHRRADDKAVGDGRQVSVS